MVLTICDANYFESIACFKRPIHLSIHVPSKPKQITVEACVPGERNKRIKKSFIIKVTNFSLDIKPSYRIINNNTLDFQR